MDGGKVLNPDGTRHDCTGMATLIAVATGLASLACLAVLAFALAVAVAGAL